MILVFKKNDCLLIRDIFIFLHDILVIINFFESIFFLFNILINNKIKKNSKSKKNNSLFH
jgi:hypothetical protein